MRNTLTLITCVLSIGFLNGQETLIVAEGSNFHDIPGDHFLTSRISSNQVFLTEYTSEGNLVWKDSLQYSGSLEFANFQLVRFGNTDEYAAILHQAPSHQINTNVYHFSKLDISTHLFSNHFEETIPGFHSAVALPKTDTSIYLFFPWNENGFETKSISSDMILVNIAHKDSLSNFTAPPANTRFRWVNDELWKLSGNEAFLRSSSHTSNITSISEYETEMESTYPSPMDFFRDFVNDDSILIVTESIADWRFIYLNKNLTEISRQSHWVPTVATTPSRYRVRKVLVYNNLIYVHAFNPLYKKVRVFIYDMNINFVCELPITMLHDDLQSIEVINERIYFKNKPEDHQISLYEIDACMFTSELDENTEFEYSIYPNPVNDILNLNFNENQQGLKLSIYDQMGRKITENFVAEKSISLDVNMLPAGIYIISIEDQVGLSKFVKL